MRNSKIVILIEGKIVQEGTQKQLINQAEIFGETFIFKEDKEQFNNKYVHAIDGIVSTISKEKLEVIIKGTLKDVITKNIQANEQLQQLTRQKSIKKKIPKLKSLRILKKLGEG